MNIVEFAEKVAGYELKSYQKNLLELYYQAHLNKTAILGRRLYGRTWADKIIQDYETSTTK